MSSSSLQAFNWVNPRSDSSDRNLIYAVKAYKLFLDNLHLEFLPDAPFGFSHSFVNDDDGNTEKCFLTGGTTGAPLKVIHNQKTFESSVDGLVARIGDQPISSFCCLPVYHVAGWMQVERAVRTNGDVLFGNYRDLISNDLSSFLKDRFISLVPTQLNLLLQSKQASQNLLSCRGVFLGGAVIPSDLEVRARKMEIPLCACYGMTETAGMVTLMNKEDFLNGAFGVGNCLSHADIKVSEDRLLIRSRSLCLMQGNRFVSNEDWFETEDTGEYVNEMGYLVTGRLDRMIISGGKKINPDMIEKKLMSEGIVEKCLVRGEVDEYWGQIVVAYVLPSKQCSGVEEIKTYLRSKVSSYEFPKKWVLTNKMPIWKEEI